MSVSLEPVSETVEEPQISENVDTPVTPAEELPDNVEPESKPIPAPEPKKRGRPKKEQNAAQEPKTPKAAPKRAVRMKPPSPTSSSEEEETPLTRDDMETLLLDYLVKRKQSQQHARRQMWSQLAGLR